MPMPYEPAIEKTALEKFQKIISRPWGLGPCAPHFQCTVCATIGRTDYEERFRNHYVAGIPSDLIPALLGIQDAMANVTTEEIHEHAFRHSWHTRRKAIKSVQITKDMVATLALRRAVDGMKVINGNSTDKMVEWLGRYTGIDRKIEITGAMNHSWEEKIMKSRKDPALDTVITLEDDEIEELPEPPLLEGPDEPAD